MFNPGGSAIIWFTLWRYFIVGCVWSVEWLIPPTVIQHWTTDPGRDHLSSPTLLQPSLTFESDCSVTSAPNTFLLSMTSSQTHRNHLSSYFGPNLPSEERQEMRWWSVVWRWRCLLPLFDWFLLFHQHRHVTQISRVATHQHSGFKTIQLRYYLLIAFVVETKDAFNNDNVEVKILSAEKMELNIFTWIKEILRTFSTSWIWYSVYIQQNNLESLRQKQSNKLCLIREILSCF